MRDAHCAHCGYDLVGLPPSSSCPECGRPYDKATRRNVSETGAVASEQQRGRRGFAAKMIGAAVGALGLAGAWAAFSDDPLRPLAVGVGAAGARAVAGRWALVRSG